ncbi:MAG: glycosyl transferase, group 1 family protein [Chitinophagaceae bacterium]|jgi:glycosyltransferase involved in cell wall biosynthesis|nr:glycosyl transferase, group 1 family protein [Chitinophagaceae bacterium]
MRIGIDAYYAFHYKTGVAHYTRTLINGLATLYPGIELVLFTDQTTELYQPDFPNVRVAAAGQDIAYHDWLSHPALQELIVQSQPGIFHGTDHGLPPLQNVKTVVTIHDLFFETHPQFYAPADVAYYRRVTPVACNKADVIISISDFTKQAIVSHYKVDPDKIRVCYQSCNQLFFERVSEERKAELRRQFDLPGKFWLYVGAVIERKNLLNICKAMHHTRDTSDTPLIVIGEGNDYLETARNYIAEKDLGERIRFLSYTEAAKGSLSFQQARDVPAFYQLATALLYPSQLEGFGIPLVEAFASGLPVLTANTSSLPEVGGNAAMYVDPQDVKGIADALTRLHDEGLREEMIAKGKQIVQNFTPATTITPVMETYRQML